MYIKINISNYIELFRCAQQVTIATCMHDVEFLHVLCLIIKCK